MNEIYFMLLSAVAAIVPVTIILVITMKVIRKAHEKEVEYVEKTKMMEIRWANMVIEHMEHEIGIIINYNDRYTQGEITSITEKWRRNIEDTEKFKLKPF